jgi:hypothetical protein
MMKQVYVFFQEERILEVLTFRPTRKEKRAKAASWRKLSKKISGKSCERGTKNSREAEASCSLLSRLFLFSEESSGLLFSSHPLSTYRI